MKLLKILEYLRSNIGKVKGAFWVCLVLLVAFDILLPRANAHYFVDKIPAFWTLFTLAGCFLLIKISKAIAHIFLARDEDYYG
ncbi:MAG: hypothetical protein WA133_10880 [Syntrophales bacterium]